MREFCKNPEVLAAVESVLNAPRPKPKSAPKPAPKVAVKPAKTAEEIAIDGLSADQFKKALLDPAKARGIERTLTQAKRAEAALMDRVDALEKRP
jgi:hypothetical protein